MAARVSTDGQTTDPQVHAMHAAGLDQVAVETVSGATPTARRSVLSALLAGVTASTGQAEATLRRVAGWASWGLLGRGVLVVAVQPGQPALRANQRCSRAVPKPGA